MEGEWGGEVGGDGNIKIQPYNRDSRGDGDDTKDGDLEGGAEGGVFAREEGVGGEVVIRG